MRAPALIALSLLSVGCRVRLPVDRPGHVSSATPPPPAVAVAAGQVEYYQISDG